MGFRNINYKDTPPIEYKKDAIEKVRKLGDNLNERSKAIVFILHLQRTQRLLK